MSRVKRGTTCRAKHNKVLKLCKGFVGRSKNCYSIAKQRLEKSLQYAYRDRRTKKRDLRSLWIVRINAATRQYDMKYSVFINGLSKLNMQIDRKILAELAVNDKEEFKALALKVKDALATAA